MLDETVYRQMAALVTAKHLQSSLGPTFTVGSTLEDASIELQEAFYEGLDPLSVSLVVEASEPIGWIEWAMWDEHDYTDDDDPGDVREWMRPVKVSQLAGGNVPFFQLVELFGHTKEQFFFVLDGREITGTVGYGDLFKLPGVCCLFVLVLELETAALRLCCRFFRQCWSSLPKNRQILAMGVWQKRYGRAYLRNSNYDDGVSFDRVITQFLDCTCLIDKSTMIRKCGLQFQSSNTQVARIFKRAERLRNWCAHPSDEDEFAPILSRDELAQFVRDCHVMIDDLVTVTPEPER